MSKRPHLFSKEVNALIAEALAPKVLEWLHEPSATVAEVESDLKEVLRSQTDGYELARDLERDRGYDADSELVDILDDVAFARFKAHDELCTTWVRAYQLQGPAIGSAVRFKDKGREYTGVVQENKATGKSTIFCEEMGHVKTGTGTHNIYVAWEDLTVQPATLTAA